MSQALDPQEIPMRVIDGSTCTDRTALIALTGKSRKTIDTLAISDPQFPTPVAGRRIARRWWYQIDAVRAYAVELARRDAARKPPPAQPGHPDELLNQTEAARALLLDPATFRSYLRYSRAAWDRGEPGYLPPPDLVEQPGRRVRRYWRRGTLAAHQARRPGRSGAGAGAGRPAGTPDRGAS